LILSRSNLRRHLSFPRRQLNQPRLYQALGAVSPASYFNLMTSLIFFMVNRFLAMSPPCSSRSAHATFWD
jgi:hypothetical protein